MKDELFLLHLGTQVLSSLKTLTPYFGLLEFTDICEVDKMKIIENRERSIQKKFRVNEKENERIKLMMRKNLIFLFLLDEPVAIKRFFLSEYKNIISEISATKYELKRIGNNINQIAKHLNENKNNQTKELMSNYQNQLENLEEKIQEVVHYISEG
ncbi:hypothetical protein LLT1_14755 [Lactococcus cremoris subsp. cremoris TIFN1]|nr:hypothetical protein LLT1_14755 [Lactococcus cremoris subsp. cremoris TIFN1]